ncbi:MAG: efflux RND transporter permease subunit, partial [Calditrichaeota bacterium]
MKNLPGYIATHPVAMSMAYLIVLCTGVFSLINLPLEFTPDIDLPSLTIEASWPSASPETIEMLVTAPIEAVCSTAAGVQNIESTSRMGLSEVKVEYSTDTNIDYSALTLSEKLAALRETLPFGVTPPQIIRHAPQEFLSGSIMTVYLIGNTTISALNRCANTDIRQKLLTINGISAIRISGGSEQAVCIEIDTKKCSALHLDPSAISAVLQQKEDQSFGAIEQGNLRRLVHVDNPAASVDEISRWEIENTPQRTIRIQDIATVRVTDVPPQRLKRINGLPTIVIDIDKTPGTHLLKLARTLRNKISTIEKELPAGINMVIQYDQSETMHQDIRDLVQRGFFSLLVVFVVLLIMMRGLYAPFVILSSIFFSVLLTLNFYFLARLT